VSNVPAETVANDGHLDDPVWVEVIAGETVEGTEGVDWVWNYFKRLGPRQYGKLKRAGLPTTTECPGTHESALKMLMEHRFLRSGQGGRIDGVEGYSGMLCLMVRSYQVPDLLL
jgi:hypothetical protein